MAFVEIILPIALRPLTYDDGGMDLRPGMAVAVRLGARKLCQGVVWRTGLPAPDFKTRPVERILYGVPLLSELQMRLWEWMAGYYMCSIGEIMAAAIPAMLKPEGLSEGEFSRGEFRSRTVKHLGLHPSIDTTEKLNETLDSLRRAKAQYKAMLSLTEQLGDVIFAGAMLPREKIDATAAVIQKLVEKDFLQITEIAVQQGFASEWDWKLPTLTTAQEKVAAQIEAFASEKPAVLLHGVAGSGKTEIFVHLAARELAAGRSVLYLLPEIPISWQLIDRLEKVFGESLMAYHSKLTARRRAEVFMALAGDDSPRIIMGTRTALLLPLRNLGLVIVDEEHDSSFKQESPAPRFHARDSALMLASLHGATALLGSATPSLESYFNAISGKYGLVELQERYGEVRQPQIIISDSLRAVKRGERTVHFNKLLLDNLAATIERGGQAILFQNRRGFSPYVECGSCSWVARCPDCNVTLTFHRADGRLRCHYCGHNAPAPRICPSCGQGELLPKGFGTEKIEDELAKIFLEARIARLDSDVASSPRAAKAVITGFDRGEIDILVGTQMVTKGFDFKGVDLVGVVNADNLLNYPDFRASERAFQMITQAAGRAGRGGRESQVVVQSSQPDHPLLLQVAAADYGAMARTQLAERKAFIYPPYCRLISITIKHRDKALVDGAAAMLASALRPIFGRRVLGPEPPTVDRVMGEHIMLLLLKVERDKSFARARGLLAGCIEQLRTHPDYKKVSLICNVDPQ